MTHETYSFFSPSVELDNSLVIKRLHWVDYAKGIGIFLVVVGHVLRGLENSSILELSPSLKFIDQWIYAFHMPLFFLVSGLFAGRSLLSKPLKNFVLDKLYTIAYPYFIWSCIQITLEHIISRSSHEVVPLTDIFKIVYEPFKEFWFLYVLFVILIIYGVSHKLKISPLLFLAFSIILYSSYALDVSIGSWSVLYLLRRYIIYFAVGLIIGHKILDSIASRTKLFILILTTLFGYIGVALAVQLNFSDHVIAIPFIAILGITSSISLGIFLENLNIFNFLKTWGQMSLEIFVAHTIPAAFFRIFLQKFLGVIDPVIHLILGIMIGIYVPIALQIISSKLKFKYMFTLRGLKK